MIRSGDPATMPPQDRLTEISEILAKGYLRLLDSRETCPDMAPGAQESLAVPPESTAACDPGSQSRSTKEVA